MNARHWSRYILVPRLCLGTHCRRGSASIFGQPAAQESQQRWPRCPPRRQPFFVQSAAEFRWRPPTEPRWPATSQRPGSWSSGFSSLLKKGTGSERHAEISPKAARREVPVPFFNRLLAGGRLVPPSDPAGFAQKGVWNSTDCAGCDRNQIRKVPDTFFGQSQSGM